MPPVDRLQPTRAASSESTCSVMEFMRAYPDDAACLDHLWRTRYAPDGETAHCTKCDTKRKFKRYQTATRRQSWTCTACGHHLHPTAGTIFHKSSTSLHLWFYAIYLITSTRCGISAKQLERELGVTYKTAWRMFNKIRNDLMSPDAADAPLSGEVEADETFVGGKPRQGERNKLIRQGLKPNYQDYWDRKAIVFAAIERGGRVRAQVVPTSRGYLLRKKVQEFVVPASMLFTDEYGGYSGLDKTYRHRRIAHRAKVYVDGDVHTQTVEGFFGLWKSGVRGVYHSVSTKWLQSYLDEYAWRYNRRGNGRAMFLDLLGEAVNRAR